jgi:site-specific recombinase XerD
MLSLVATSSLPLTAAQLDHSLLVAGWTDHLDSQVSAGLLSGRTAASYGRNIQRWLVWLAASTCNAPTPRDVLAYVASLRDSGLSGASCNAYLDAVRSLYRWAESNSLYPAIGRSVAGVKVRKDEPLDCLDKTAVAGLLAHVEGASLTALRNRALVRVMFSTGLRLVSLVEASVGNVDIEAGTLSYRGKGDRDAARRAVLSPSALDAVVAYLQSRNATLNAPLFCGHGNRSNGVRLSDRSVRQVITGLMEAAGHIQRSAAGHIQRPRVLSAHSLRRSAITAAYEAHGLDAAQLFAGHADPKTTRRAYARVEKGRTLAKIAVTMDL